jgi:ABC-type uncharacterized transport system ATPase subunit
MSETPTTAQTTQAILANILGAASGALVGGIFSLVGTGMNNAETERQQREARAMAERQWDWSATQDRFNMDQKLKQDGAQAQQNHMSQLNNMLQTSTALQDRVRNLFARKG